MAFKHGDHKHDTVAQAKACAAGEPIPETPQPDVDLLAALERVTGKPIDRGCIRYDDGDTTDYEAIQEARMEARRERDEDRWDRYHERAAWGE